MPAWRTEKIKKVYICVCRTERKKKAAWDKHTDQQRQNI